MRKYAEMVVGLRGKLGVDMWGKVIIFVIDDGLLFFV